MGQQISIEDAFPTFQRKAAELFEANLILQAQVDVQGRELAALREENERLKRGTPEPETAGGPDLAAQPPYRPDSDRS